MKRFRDYSHILLIGILLVGQLHAQSDEDIAIQVKRVSDRVLVLNGSFMENNVVALSTAKGLVVVDSTGIPSIARKMRTIIEKEFGSTDFKYLINTHYHWDHSWGNMAFPEAKTVAHERCVEPMRRAGSRMESTIESFKRNIQTRKDSLVKLEPGSEEEKRAKAYITEAAMAVSDYSEGFKVVPPMVTFDDRMTLDLGDMTLEMVYFGMSHSGADIFIYIPEENLLLTGDIFLDGRWVPLFSAGGDLEIPRWIEVLNGLLADDNIKLVIPGHQHFWPRDRLEMWRDYIVDLWAGVNAVKKEGLTVEHALERFPLEEKYLYLRELGHSDEELKEFQERNVRAFWRQLK